MAAWLAAQRGNLAMLQPELPTHQDPKINFSAMEQHSKLTGLKLSSIPARKSPLGPDGTEKMNPKYHTLQTDGL